MTNNAPFPKPAPFYSIDWAARLVQRLDQFLKDYAQGERLVQGELVTLGGRRRKTTRVTASYQIKRTDEVISSNVSAAVTHTLPPSPAIGAEFIVVDASGAADSNPISLAPPSGTNLNGGSSAVVAVSAAYGRAVASYDGTAYFVTPA